MTKGKDTVLVDTEKGLFLVNGKTPERCSKFTLTVKPDRFFLEMQIDEPISGVWRSGIDNKKNEDGEQQ